MRILVLGGTSFVGRAIVVDVSGYVPRHVGQAMDMLGDRVGRYLFISSHAVYDGTSVVPASDEDAPRRPPARDTEELTDASYGPLKVACEDDVVARYGSRATVVRHGLSPGQEARLLAGG